ncbi:MAG: polysaccharide deacetylase family protein [Ktedonobacterales bacterium]
MSLLAVLVSVVIGGWDPLGAISPFTPGGALTPNATATATFAPVSWAFPTAPPDVRHRIPVAPTGDQQGCANTPTTHSAPTPPAYAIFGGRQSGPHGWMKPGSKAVNEVALTFDDGPTPYSTPTILSFLERTHTPATFFVLGQYVQDFPALAQREWADGFTIGVHTWDHPNMKILTPQARSRELGSTIKVLHQVIGPQACLWLWRPPYGSFDGAVLQQAAQFGLATIIWDVDPRDWSRPGVQNIVSTILAEVRPGAIILMHDGPAAREQTAAALPILLAHLQALGLTPVLLPRLLADEGYPGITPPTGQIV